MDDTRTCTTTYPSILEPIPSLHQPRWTNHFLEFRCLLVRSHLMGPDNHRSPKPNEGYCESDVWRLSDTTIGEEERTYAYDSSEELLDDIFILFDHVVP